MKKILESIFVLLMICGGSSIFAQTQLEMLREQNAGFGPTQQEIMLQQQEAGFAPTQQEMLQEQEAGFAPSQSSAQVAPAGGGATGSGGTSGGSTAKGTSISAQLQNPIKYDTFSDFVAAVLKVAVQILMPFVVLAFIWSGFLFVKAQGNDTELTTAKEAIKWSIVGAFILMGAWGFAQIISTTISTLTQ